jgi:hypothetical protein
MNESTPDAPRSLDASFINLLQNHRSGVMLDEIGQAMRTIVDAALLTGRPGGLTVKIAFAPTSSGAIEIQDDVKLTMPKADKATSLFFVSDHGALVRNNPNQLEMPLRSIEGGATVTLENLKQVGGQNAQ